MSIDEQQLAPNQSEASNGWQNIGLYYCFVSEQDLSPVEKLVLMDMCRHSFGFRSIETKRMTQSEWSLICNVSRQTFSTVLKSLISKGFVKAVHGKEFVPNGGSVAYAYRIKFPTNGKVQIGSSNKEQEDVSGSKKNITEGW